MLAIAISLLFGFAAFAAVMVIHASFVHGARRAEQIMAELSADRALRAAQVNPASYSRSPALPIRRYAAA